MSFEADPGVNSRGRYPRHRRQKEKFATQDHTVSRKSKPFSDVCSRAEQSWTIESIICISDSCSLPEIPADTAVSNPILRPVSDGLPALDVVSERQAFFGLGKAILQYESEATQMESRCREALDQGRTPDFDEIFVPLEKAKCFFDGVWRICNMLHMTTDTIEGDRAIALHRRANKAANGMISSDVIFEALGKMKEAHDKGEHELDVERLRIVERHIAQMKASSYGMPAKKREALTSCMYRFDEPNAMYNYKTEVRKSE